MRAHTARLAIMVKMRLRRILVASISQGAESYQQGFRESLIVVLVLVVVLLRVLRGPSRNPTSVRTKYVSSRRTNRLLHAVPYTNWFRGQNVTPDETAHAFPRILPAWTWGRSGIQSFNMKPWAEWHCSGRGSLEENEKEAAEKEPGI
eukprot:2822547-Rhodomonas_salina.2